MCQGFSHFSGFLHHFALAKAATSSVWVKIVGGPILPLVPAESIFSAIVFNPLKPEAPKIAWTILMLFIDESSMNKVRSISFTYHKKV